MKSMDSSLKLNQVKKKEIDDHTLTVHNRLNQALSLGIRHIDNKRRWQCIDVETQLHALRAMSSFINCTPSLKHYRMKETISDMLLALEGILRSESERILILAVDVTLKLISYLGSSGRSMSNYSMLDVAISLSLLLRTKKIPIATSCAISLSRILKNQNKECWEAMIKNHIIDGVICAMQDYAHGIHPTDYFIEMASLLKTILHRRSSLRYPVWSNTILMDKLLDMCSSDDISIYLIILQVLSELALCGNGAKKILESEKSLPTVVHSLEKSNPDKVRMEALKLCRHLMRSENGNLLIFNTHCESIVQGIIYAMGECKPSSSNKLLTDQMPLVLEACRAALITKWAGKHHPYFWHLQIDKVLDVLIGNVSKKCKEISLSDKLIAKLSDNNFTNTRPYIWDILGWLATHCEEDFLPETKGTICCLDALIFCSCAVAVDLMHRRQSVNSIDYIESEPVCRAVMMLILSPSEYISSKAKLFFAEAAEPYKDDILQKILEYLKLISLGKASVVLDSVRSAINLIGLTCFSTLTQFQSLIIKARGLEVISAVIDDCLNSDIHVSRSGIASHLQNTVDKACCFNHVEEWEGEDILLFYSLQALSQLIQFSNLDQFKNNFDANSLIKSLKSILNSNSSSGPKLYAAYALSFFGLFGIQNNLQRNMESIIDDNELTDFEFVLSHGQSLRVHGAIIFARCPYLLPSKKHYEKLNSPNSRHKVKLSDRVEYGCLMKIMEYVYTGFFVIDDDNHLKPLKVLANGCQLKPLFRMLLRKLPRWGSDNGSLSVDFTRALNVSSNSFFDIILEANADGKEWECSMCQLSKPHFHAHKIILSTNCYYLRAMFNSGMHESQSKSIKVSVCRNALSKLINYFYSGKFPTIQIDCIWKNTNVNQQLQELKQYVELSSLAEQWLLEDVKDNSLTVIFACLDFDQKASTQLIPYAIELGQWEIVEHAVVGIAHLYPKMRSSGELEEFDEVVVDMLRSEYVRYSQR